MRKDLEDWLRGEARQEPLFVAWNVPAPDVVREVEYPVISLLFPPSKAEPLPAEKRTDEKNAPGEGAAAVISPNRSNENRIEEKAGESTVEEGLIEAHVTKDNSGEEDVSDKILPSNEKFLSAGMVSPDEVLSSEILPSEILPSKEVLPSNIENAGAGRREVPYAQSPGASIFEDPFAKLLTESYDERFFEENEKKSTHKNENNGDGRIINAKNKNENRERPKLDDDWERRPPRGEFPEWEATRFAERLRRIEQMRRSASYKRSGFRGNRGRFLAFCIFVLFLVGTVFAAYRHLQRNSYASLLEGAKTLYDQEQYEPALAAYKQTSERYPRKVEPLLGMAHAAERVGRVEEAIMAYRASLELFPASAAPSRSGIFYEIGRLYSTLKVWDRAQENFQEAVAVDSTHYGAYFALGGVLEEQGKPEEAIRAYKQALDLSPSSDAAQEAIRRVSLLLPSAEPKQDQDSLAEQKYEHSVQVGSVALELKHYEEASRYFSEALAIRSDDAKVWVGFADSRVNLGDTAGAIKSLERALERDPDHDGAKSKLSKLKEGQLKEGQNKKKTPSRPRKTPRSTPRSSKKKISFRVKPAEEGGSSDRSADAGGKNKTLSRREFFVRGVDHYRREEYAQAFEAFLACLRSGEQGSLPSFPLAGEAGPLWKGFRTALNIPSDVKLLAEAVRLNPVDRDLYLNLSMTGTKMGVDRKTWRTTLNDIYSHALARR
ncbi:MAG: tetratricopeptide repeat protein [Synergistaceae bacterium]|nr:tetratricopeptide repeat protein [Synergistaceae bacterium]